MNAPEPSPNSRGIILVWASLLAFVYVLSVGPVVKLEFAEKISKDTVEMIYAPLVWLCDTPVGDKLVRPGLIWYGKTIWRWELPIK